MPTLDPEVVWATARSVGFDADQATILTAIVKAESDSDSDAINDNPRTGDLSYGLAQINMFGELGPERRAAFGLDDNRQLLDPATNLRAAFALSRRGTDWRPWSTYGAALHVLHLARAQQAAQTVAENWAAFLAPATSGDPVRTGSAALAFMIAEHSDPSADWENYCLKVVRTALGVPSKFRSAAVAYANTTKRHPDSTPPPGVPIWWTGGYGHVALSAGGGYCWSNDILRVGKIDKVRISTITNSWGKPYKGWSEDINGVTVYTPQPKIDPATVVDLSNLIAAFKTDPGRPQGQGIHEGDVRPVELALMHEGLLDDRWARDGAAGTKTVSAYSRWQKRCGFSGDDANGIPGRTTLTKLGQKYGFRVAA